MAQFGIRTRLVEPGFFRTEQLTDDSTTYAEPTIDDYAEQTREIVTAWRSMDGKQSGDPAKLADALVKLVALKKPPAASLLVPTPCRRSRPRPTRCSPRPELTAFCLVPSRTMRPDG